MYHHYYSGIPCLRVPSDACSLPNSREEDSICSWGFHGFHCKGNSRNRSSTICNRWRGENHHGHNKAIASSKAALLLEPPAVWSQTLVEKTRRIFPWVQCLCARLEAVAYVTNGKGLQAYVWHAQPEMEPGICGVLQPPHWSWGDSFCWVMDSRATENLQWLQWGNNKSK